MFVRVFGWSVLVSALALVGTWLVNPTDPRVLYYVGVLAVLEVSLSFDNAVVNATVLRRMSLAWQRAFLTIGIVIAVFGMRLIFPFAVVALTSQLSPGVVFELATRFPDQYEEHLRDAHPAIACFGGIFLAMVFLDFIFEEREFRWLTWLEDFFARIGRIQSLSTIVSLAAILVTAGFVSADRRLVVLTAGALGLLTYLAIGALATYLSDRAASGSSSGGNGGRSQLALAAGSAGFALFLYLEVLDASFSFDGVVAAFAVSNKIFVIAVGLGIGALYIRSLTVYLVRKGTLSKYVFLEHGAHYAIGALAVLLLVGIGHPVRQEVAATVSVGLIGLAFLSSVFRHRAVVRAEGEAVLDDEVPAPVGGVVTEQERV